MKLHIVGITGLVLLLAPVVGAQTKVSGAHKCAKPEVVGTTDVADKPGHTMTLVKDSCEWTTPIEMEGLKAKDGTSTIFVDTTATRSSSTGVYVGTMENGDKFFVSFHDTAPVKDGKAGAGKGSWSYTGGTGKLKGIEGKGTYTTSMNEDGTGGAEVEGEYSIAAAAPKKAMEKKAN
jgi:hypothetical protein